MTVRRVVVPLVLLALLATPAVTFAVGHEHAGRAAVVALAPPVVVQGYRIELVADPGPLEAGRQAWVIARIWRDAPMIGADVWMAVIPAEHAEHVGHGVLMRVAEQKAAGSYPLRFVPAAAGRYQVRVELTQAEGARIDPPIAVAYDVDVGAAAAFNWWPIIGAAFIALLGLMAIRARTASLSAALDLLALPRLSRVLKSPLIQPVLQIALLATTGVVAYLGFADVQDASVNVAPRLTWTIWWASVIFTLLVAGRAWCVMCPFGALNEWSARLMGAWRRLPRVFRNLWWGTALFLLLTWADEQLGVVRRPSVTAWIVVGLAVIAVGIGLRYERRSFCRYLCPIGGLLGLYSMVAPVELRAKDAAVCRTHATKDCYRGGAGSRGCPMFEFPATMDRNTYCTFCLECARGCASDNLSLRLRAFGADLWRSAHRHLDEAYLAVMLVGLTILVTARMLPAWSVGITTLERWLPSAIRESASPLTLVTAIDSVVLLLGALVVAPLLTLGAAALADRFAGGAGIGLRRSAVLFAYMFVPIALGMHLAHNSAHLLIEGPGIVPALERAVATYTPWAVGEPDWHVPALAGRSVVSAVQTTLMLAAFILSLVTGHRLALRAYGDRRVAGRALVPLLLLALLFTVSALIVLGQPMGLRHSV